MHPRTSSSYAALAALATLSFSAAALEYPPAPTAKVEDIYHGIAVADPYRPLEDVDSAETRAWVEANQALTENYLQSLPGRDRLQRRLEQIWNLPRFGLPQTVGEQRYFLINDGLQPQPVLYREPVNGQARVPLLDINTLSADGTTALKSWQVSPTGEYLAYGVTEAGEDWTRIRVRDLRTGQDGMDLLKDIKFSNIAWTHNGRGFFYSRFPQRGGTFDTLADQSLWYHQVGTPQSADVMVFANPQQPRHNYWAEVDDSGRWLTVAVYEGASDKNRLWVRDLKNPKDPVLLGKDRMLVRDFSSQNAPIGVLDDVLYVLTTENAPRGAIRAINLLDPKSSWITIVEESEDTLRDAAIIGGSVVTHHLRSAASVINSWSPIGEPQYALTPPGMGAIGGIRGSSKRREVFFTRSGTVEPEAVWRGDLSTGSSAPWHAPKSVINAENFVTEQFYATSRDGTKVPYFLTRDKFAKPDRSRPTWLYGYGGFNIPTKPKYRVYAPLWIEAGGIFVVANMRGGGEFGEAWHAAGTKLQKQNVFDDFIAVAEDLIAKGWTTPKQLAIHGRSNGGLLVGAVTNQRPDLFGAALPGVGVMDMLRFHKFTIGWAWTGDYGSSDDAKQFMALVQYSPVHNVAAGKTYPPIMVYTADHDDRVVPGHSFKYAAALQNTDTGPAPTLIRIESHGGHGSGKPTAAQIAEARDLLLFAGYHTGIRWNRGATAVGSRLDRLTGK